MPDEVASTNHAGENCSLREHVVRIGVGRRCYIGDHSREGVPRNVKDGMDVRAHFYLVRFPVLPYPHLEVREHFEQIKHTRIHVVRDVLDII